MKKIYLISTVGISLLRNCLCSEKKDKLYKIANLSKEEMQQEDVELIEEAAKSAHEILKTADRKKLKSVSAELNGILSYEDEFNEKPIFHHVLIVTDTFIGEKAAEVLSTWLIAQSQKEQRVSTDILAINDLRTARGEELRVALSDIVPELTSRIEGASEDGWYIVFNLTGGFKGVNGFLQTAAMLWANETIYVFEGSEELMHIPRIPVKIDISIIQENFSLFKQLEESEVPLEKARKAGIAGSLLFEFDGKASLSEWGKLIWKKAYSEISGEKLLASPHEKIVFSDGFLKDVKGLPADRMRHVNRSIQAHADFLNDKLEGQSTKYKFKPINDSKKLPSTHERYAWVDKDAKRIFMHEENGSWVIDELGKHLA